MLIGDEPWHTAQIKLHAAIVQFGLQMAIEAEGIGAQRIGTELHQATVDLAQGVGLIEHRGRADTAN
ncbi:hypothetical protein D3C75_1312470 [compost metagenome]